MTYSYADHARMEQAMQALKARGEPFAMATVVRTVDATSAKPGGKALLDRDGTLLMGWIGGGCARGAVGRAAREAIADGAPQLVSLRPQDLLDHDGVAAGDTRDGIRFARNGCPSRGTMDVFVEPVLPLPRLSVCGAGPVAVAVAELGARFDLMVTRHTVDTAPAGDASHQVTADMTLCPDFIVVATQGQGDLDALRAAAVAGARYVAFVGSSRKFATLRARLIEKEPDLALPLDAVHAPAGLDINAITPNEIALSILAEITRLRRAARTPDA